MVRSAEATSEGKLRRREIVVAATTTTTKHWSR